MRRIGPIVAMLVFLVVVAASASAYEVWRLPDSAAALRDPFTPAGKPPAKDPTPSTPLEEMLVLESIIGIQGGLQAIVGGTRVSKGDTIVIEGQKFQVVKISNDTVTFHHKGSGATITKRFQ